MRLARTLVVCLMVLGWASATARADDTSAVVPIAEGVEHVRAEVAGVRVFGTLPVPAEQVAAESALTYVQSRLSPAIYAAGGGSDDLQTAFDLHAGLCGQMTEAFMQILEGVGVEVLPVQFFYMQDGERMTHVAAQVRWGGAWHYVDPTWGALFERKGEVLSIEQVLKLKHPNRYALMNRLVPWTAASERRGGDWSPLSYLTRATDRQVVANGAGTVSPPRTVGSTSASTSRATASLRHTSATWDLSLMPDYVGTYVPYAGRLVAVRQRLAVPRNTHELSIGTRGKLCGGLGVLHVGPVDVPFGDVPDAGELTVSLPAGVRVVTLWADGGDPAEPCAVLLTGLHAA